MKYYLPIALALTLTMIAGCGNKEEPKAAAKEDPKAAAALPGAPTQYSQPSLVPPPVPPNAVDDGIQRPKPGQANDHSSPTFKAGGTEEKK